MPSRRSGFVVGSLAVTDQDKAAQYLFSTQDARFEFRNGQLALKPNTFLPTQANGTSIELLVQVVDAADPASQAVLPITLNVGSSVSPWQNFRDRLDVSRDRTITALDALQVINYLNLNGSQVLPSVRSLSESQLPDWDVNGDGMVSPIDALLVTNFLNINGTSSSGEGESSANPSVKLSIQRLRVHHPRKFTRK